MTEQQTADTDKRPYLVTSWLDPRIEVRPSSIQGNGLFALQPIRAGEAVIVWGGVLFTKAEIKAGKALQNSFAEIGEDLYMGDRLDQEMTPDGFMNHSCDPNLWFQDEVTLVARRDIKRGEELTADYAMWCGDPEWTAVERCACGSALCRGAVTGDDWRRRDLRERYLGRFSPYLNRRIARLRE
jgi:SET domain-containing protein